MPGSDHTSRLNRGRIAGSAFLLSLSLLLVAPLLALEVSQDFASDPIVVADEPVKVAFKAGELRIVGTEGDELAAHLTATCRKGKPRCVRELGELRIVAIPSGGNIELVFEGLNKRKAKRMNFEAVVRVPESSPVNVKMGVGALEIENLRGDLAVDMWIGDLVVRMSETDVHSVLMDAGIGDAEINAFGGGGRHRRPMLVGREVSWTDGSGSARLDLDLQIGDISVKLE